MAISFVQTDTNSFCPLTASFCSTDALGGQATKNKQAAVGASPGVGSVTQNIDAVAVDLDQMSFECLADGYNFAAGNWTIRLNVTTANANLTWNRVTICRMDVSCVSQGTILATSAALGISLATTGVKSTVQSGLVQVPNTGDKVIIILGFSNAAGTSQSFAFTPDQNIDSPYTALPPPPQDAGRGWMYYNTLARM